MQISSEVLKNYLEDLQKEYTKLGREYFQNADLYGVCVMEAQVSVCQLILDNIENGRFNRGDK